MDTAPFHRPRSAYLPIIITSYLLLFIFSPFPSPLFHLLATLFNCSPL